MDALSGFLDVLKPPGLTSFAVVARLRRILGTRRIGHLGTLDPAAKGVLPVAVGRATRLIEHVGGGKAYRAEITLGTTTDTLDAEGTVVATADWSSVTTSRIEEMLGAFRGRQMQVPPMASAIHHQGRRLYELFREGRHVDVEAREVEIHEIALVSSDLPRFVIDVSCGAGTYIRSLARDLGERLGCGAHLSDLVRTRSGPFPLEEAHSLEALEARVAAGQEPPWFPMRRALNALPWLELKPCAVSRVQQGCRIDLGEVEDPPDLAGAGIPGVGAGGALCILATASGELVAVARMQREVSTVGREVEIRPVKVMLLPAQATTSLEGGDR